MKIPHGRIAFLVCLLPLIAACSAFCAEQPLPPPDLEDSQDSPPEPARRRPARKPAKAPAAIVPSGVILDLRDISFAEKTLYGHYSMVNAVLFSPDGKTIFTGGDDSSVHVIDVETGEDRYSLAGHTGWVTALAISPDGNILAAASNDRTVSLWDWKAASLKKKLGGIAGKVNDVAFSPDGKWLAAASADKTVTLWETSGWKFDRAFNAHEGWVMKTAFSPDSSLLATAGADGEVKVWKLTDRSSSTIQTGGGTVHSVLFSPDGKSLIFPNAANGIETVSTDTWTPEMIMGGHEDTITCMAVSPDGRYAASGDESGTILVRRMEDGSLSRRISSSPLIPLALAFSPDGKYLASARDARETRIMLSENPLEPLVYGEPGTPVRRAGESEEQFDARTRAAREKSSRLRIQEETRHVRYAAQFRKELIYFSTPASLGNYRYAGSLFEIKAAGTRMLSYVPYKKAEKLPGHKNRLSVSGLLRNRGGNKWELVNAWLEDETNNDRFSISKFDGGDSR